MKNVTKGLLGVALCSILAVDQASAFQLKVTAHPDTDKVDDYVGKRNEEHFHLVKVPAEGKAIDFSAAASGSGYVFEVFNIAGTD
jgi:hypothetical protein